EARQALGLAGGRRTVLVTGGSQGALRIDRAAAGAVRILRHRADLQLLVLTGPAHAGQLDRAGEEAGALAVRAVPFLERMELAYAAADLVVSRAGASTVAEVAVCGLPAILVPYPHATANHQEANARALARAGGAVVLPDAELGPEALAARVVELVDAPHRMETMGARAAAWGRPDAGHALAALVVEGASR
ncbi:MAG TPA: UDP-N-acetylglucosamine--N-acetylmuramyl-(pentapeptide) pyrophosphoryl-undecaprenol N-acetylglucosamine transferase, partial [Actinomycetota bacterium]|nr:UDP-N-acetylglucosamine--N-acetylmuramyl-(pentapeptide) pyrophosphoryl-undecaprenol N-acetylglucosamine transferase [Actinomycetota bacterium]